MGIARRLPVVAVVLYLSLGAATWVWAWRGEPHDWVDVALLTAWITAAVGFVLRRRLGLAVLLFIEVMFLFGELAAVFGWSEEPGHWLRLCAQFALVLLLLTPPMARYASRTRQRLPGER